jgi:hypothetical protein
MCAPQVLPVQGGEAELASYPRGWRSVGGAVRKMANRALEREAATAGIPEDVQ